MYTCDLFYLNLLFLQKYFSILTIANIKKKSTFKWVYLKTIKTISCYKISLTKNPKNNHRIISKNVAKYIL